MKKLIYMAITVLLCVAGSQSMAQTTNNNLLLTADSLATGNYKDVFKSFFQLAFDRLISDKKELLFTANPYAVMTRANPKLLIDTSYIKYNHLRNLNFGFGAKLDDDFKFNGFSSGITYAVINKRDVTISRQFVNLVNKADAQRTDLQTKLDALASTFPSGPQRVKYRKQVTALFNGDLKVGETDTLIQNSIKQYYDRAGLAFENTINFKRLSQNTYDSLKQIFDKLPLLTLGLSDTTYEDKFFFSNVAVHAEYVHGLGRVREKPKNTLLELNIKTAYNKLDDSTLAGRDLMRGVFTFEPGFNLVFKIKQSSQSWLEYKLSGCYRKTMGTLYTGEEASQLTINSVLRVRVFNDIWIPLQIDYDPKTGNVFGFLNLRLNFKALGKTSGASN